MVLLLLLNLRQIRFDEHLGLYLFFSALPSVHPSHSRPLGVIMDTGHYVGD